MVETPVQPPGSRLRIGIESIKGWDVAEQPGDEFWCLGYFRAPGELVCAPRQGHPAAAAITESRQSLLEAEHDAAGLTDPLQGLPPTSTLVALSRFTEFTARWVADARTQLDLKLGVETLKRLGFGGEKCSVWTITWGRLLVVVSRERLLAHHWQHSL
jgi:hypothetical protein